MSSFFICKVIHIIMMIFISMVTNLEGNKHHCYFIPCKYACVLKRPSNGEVGIKHLQFKKKGFFPFVSKRKDEEKFHLTGHHGKVWSISWVIYFRVIRSIKISWLRKRTNSENLAILVQKRRKFIWFFFYSKKWFTVW